MNTVVLVAQLPLTAAVHAWAGVGYVAATAVALAVLVVARFAVCDRLLYRRGDAHEPGRTIVLPAAHTSDEAA